MFGKLKSVIKTPEIEFLCIPELKGIIPEPVPANKALPDWYKKLPSRLEKDYMPTVKRCSPFLDALSLGWTIPLAADVYVKINNDGGKIDFQTKFPYPLVEKHPMEQITCKESPNPICPVQPLKFINYWMIKVPEDYSLLFINPLGTTEKKFTCFAGMVHCDEYKNFVHFPFIFNVTNYEGIIQAGTPLVQVIPIKRDTLIKKTNIRSINKKEKIEQENIVKKIAVHMSYYRDFIWKPKLKSKK